MFIHMVGLSDDFIYFLNSNVTNYNFDNEPLSWF